MGRELIETWGDFVESLIEVKRCWDEHRELMLELRYEKRFIENQDLKLQAHLAQVFNTSEFEVMIPRLVDYYRRLGGIGELRVERKDVELDAIKLLKEIRKEKSDD